jgi:hypothetical protein
MQNAGGYLAAFEQYFRDEDYADSSIVQISPAESQEVVTNSVTCRAVLNAALVMLRQNEPTWAQIEQRGYDFTVLRYGPYYAILVRWTADPATGGVPPYVPLMVFRSDGLTYVTTILV